MNLSAELAEVAFISQPDSEKTLARWKSTNIFDVDLSPVITLRFPLIGDAVDTARFTPIDSYALSNMQRFRKIYLALSSLMQLNRFHIHFLTSRR